MRTKSHTRMVERRLEPAKRKYHAALAPILDSPGFAHVQTFFEFKPRKDSVEITTMFRYRGEKYRFDYEIGLERRLPRVGPIREFFWDSLAEYRRDNVRPLVRYQNVT